MSPAPGVPNNPDGVNSFSGFGSEPQYGEATRVKTLGAMAPLAGGNVAAGAVNAPKRAQRAAQQPATPQAAPQPPVPPPFQEPPGPSLTVRDIWQQILSTPGVDQLPEYPLLRQIGDKA